MSREPNWKRHAIALCLKRGQNPTEMVGHAMAGSEMWFRSPRWQVVEQELRTAWELHCAMLEIDAELRASPRSAEP